MHAQSFNAAHQIIQLLLACCAVSFACEMPPAEQHVADSVLVARTTNIYLAKATSVKESGVFNTNRYCFSVLEVIKGDSIKSFCIDTCMLGGWEPAFHDHAAEKFWNSEPSRNWGRLHNWKDCRIYPAFRLGSTYLIFRDKPYHSRSFELIKNVERDKWYHYVKNNVEHISDPKKANTTD